MVKLGLQLKANLENITNLRPEGEDFRWYLKFKCMNCGEEPDKWQYICRNETVAVKGSRGHANLISKCKLCSRENSVDIIEDSDSTYDAVNNNEYKTIVAFDCRGVEPIDYSPRGGFIAEGVDSGTKFNDVNLTEKEWVDYDERSRVSVGIYDLTHKFSKL